MQEEEGWTLGKEDEDGMLMGQFLIPTAQEEDMACRQAWAGFGPSENEEEALGSPEKRVRTAMPSSSSQAVDAEATMEQPAHYCDAAAWLEELAD